MNVREATINDIPAITALINRNNESLNEDLAALSFYPEESERGELQVLKRKKVKLVFAEVHYKCASAVPFYYKFGFRIVGFQQDYFGVGHDAIILKLGL